MASIRILLAIVGQLLASAALAQANAPAPPDCYPAQVGGSGTRAYAGSAMSNHATPVRIDALWWHCPDPYGPARDVLLTCPHAELPTCLADTAWLAAQSLTRGDLDTHWRAMVEDRGRDAVYQHVRRQLAAPMSATRPPVPAWRVAPNGGRATRPAYALIPSATASAPAALGPQSGTALTGELCDMRVRVVAATGNAYGVFDAARDRVALCRRQ